MQRLAEVVIDLDLLILLLYLVHSFPVLITVVHELCRIDPRLQLTGRRWNRTTENLFVFCALFWSRIVCSFCPINIFP